MAGSRSDRSDAASSGGGAHDGLFEHAGMAIGASSTASPRPIAEPAAAATQPQKSPKRTGKIKVVDDRSGHRARLRERFRDAGPDAIPDYELLEMILFRVYPRADTKPLAKALIAKFKTFAEVVHAPPERLKEIEGVGDRAVEELKLIRAASLRLMQSGILERPLLATWNAVIDYCRAAQGHDAIERFRILFLDKRNHLIEDEVQQSGTVDHTPVYVREIVKRALELGATALVLVHNHPSGDPSPSRADIDMTKMIVDAAKPLGIIVHDHIIVGRQGHVSLKSAKLM